MSTVEDRTALSSVRRLSPAELGALADFAAVLRSRFGSRFLRLIVFGSRARGEANEESDLDVAVIMADEGAGLRREVWDLATEIRLKTEIPVSPLVFSEGELLRLKAMGRGIAAVLEAEGMIL